MATTNKSKTKKRDGRSSRKWSGRVTRESDALDLKHHLFKSDDPEKIARSLKRSAVASKKKKGTPYQSAMSMLTFYINRGGSNLPDKKKKVLERAKDELRELFGKEKKD